MQPESEDVISVYSVCGLWLANVYFSMVVVEMVCLAVLWLSLVAYSLLMLDHNVTAVMN